MYHCFSISVREKSCGQMVCTIIHLYWQEEKTFFQTWKRAIETGSFFFSLPKDNSHLFRLSLQFCFWAWECFLCLRQTIPCCVAPALCRDMSCGDFFNQYLWQSFWAVKLFMLLKAHRLRSWEPRNGSWVFLQSLELALVHNPVRVV